MTREEALKNLNLPASASIEEIEKAYSRLVRRYPPEFQPEKFRQVDDSYRMLTSLPYRLERLLSPAMKEAALDPNLFSFSPSVSEACLAEAIMEIRRDCLLKHLWGTAG